MERQAVLDRWRALTFAAYAERGERFLSGEPDRFRNPVGHVLGENLGLLLDGILADAPAEDLRPALDAIVRIRAVQDLPPSVAVEFVFLLKRALREESGGGKWDLPPEVPAGLLERIDRLALHAFDLYVQCHRQLHELRLREIRARMPVPLRNARAGSDAAGGCAE